MIDPAFTDILAANAVYSETFHLGGMRPEAARGLAVLTCIDSRIEPLTMLGLVHGDAKILRNAGARVTPDALRSLVLAVHLLGVERIAVIHHTRCKMAQATEAELRIEISQRAGAPADDWEFLAIDDPPAVLASDLAVLRACPLLPERIAVIGLMYDVDTGRLHAGVVE